MIYNDDMSNHCPKNQIDISKKKFNRLTAIQFKEFRNGRPYWLFECKCRKLKVLLKGNVVSGHTKSCGCLNSELSFKRCYKHGMGSGDKKRRNRFYVIWMNMKSRCLNRNNSAYQNYGGRGIEINNSWLKFINFKKDMFKSYQKHIKNFGIKNTLIDRINNNKGYHKSNCHWTTIIEQANNKRDNIKLTYDKETLTLIEWADKLGVHYETIRRRIKRKWPIEKIIHGKKRKRI